jgi:WD40 repeat-containing protein SMU1
MNVAVESSDVIRLVLQFLRENNLTKTMKQLQAESQVSLNTVENLQSFVADIQFGRWDTVLPQVGALNLPESKLEDLYEQIVLEMIELREMDTARAIMRTTQAMHAMKTESPDRYVRLENLAQRTFFDPREAYPGTNKEKRRTDLAQDLAKEVSVVQPARLLSLITQALKWQQHQGLLPPGSDYDLFRGAKRQSRKDMEDKVVKKAAGHIKFGKKSHPECAQFDPGGQMLISGSVDGFVEVWDYESCKLKKDLKYQAKEELMMHDEAVIAMSYSRDGELVSTGSQDGKMKVWKISTGVCLRRFDRAHAGGVTAIDFSRDGTQLLSGGYDQMVRVHGIKSGRSLKEFRGHSSYVNCVTYTADGGRALSGSSDGTVKVWDVKSMDCLTTFKPPEQQANATSEPAIHTIEPMATNIDHFIVCSRSSSVHIVTLQGQVIKTFSSGKREGGNFLCCTGSPQGRWLYCVGEDGVLYCFNVGSGQLDHVLKVSEKDVIGVHHHPHRNLVATYGGDGVLRLWRA